jgi:hypothetical protein
LLANLFPQQLQSLAAPDPTSVGDLVAQRIIIVFELPASRPMRMAMREQLLVRQRQRGGRMVIRLAPRAEPTASATITMLANTLPSKAGTPDIVPRLLPEVA